MGVAVEVGSYSDPDDALGMAHFVEHMMFMGTKQHPEPGGFDNFLAANGAQISNAATGSSSTTYAFSTPHRAFKEGVKRFSEFFTDPLFDSKGAMKEMKAVNQEFQMHKDQDGYRQYMVSNQLTNKAHPQSRFSIGNQDTLVSVKNEQLLEWVQSHYSSNLIHVAIYTALNVSEIECLVAESLERVKNHHYIRYSTKGIPSQNATLLNKVVHTKPQTETRQVSLKWALRDKFATLRDSRPDRQLSFVLGDEGPGSLTDRLKKKHYILGLSAGMSKNGRDNANYEIDLSLTEKGLEHRDEVIAVIFKTLHELLKAGVPKYVFDEQKLRDETAWKIQKRTSDTFNAAMSTSDDMFDEDLSTFPRRQSVLTQYDANGIEELLESLTPERLAMEQMGGKFPPDNAIKLEPATNVNFNGTVQREEYYKAEFAIEHITEMALAYWKSAYQGGNVTAFRTSGKTIIYPDTDGVIPRNDYIQKDITVGEISPNTPIFPKLPKPTKVIDDLWGRMFVAVDHAFGDPYVSFSVQIKTAGSLMDKYGPKASIMTDIIVDSISEGITATLYPYSVAGLGAGLRQGVGTNIWVDVTGHVTDRRTLLSLLDVVIAPLKQYYPDHTSKETFEVLRKATLRYYKNKKADGARQTASRVLWSKMSNERHPPEEMAKLVEALKYEEMRDFQLEMFKFIKLEGFAYGMITESTGKEMYQAVETLVRRSPAPGNLAVKEIWPSDNTGSYSRAMTDKAQEYHTKMRVLPGGEDGPYYYWTNGTSRSNATVLFIDGGHLPCHEAMALPILFKEVGNMFFKELRTVQQTGYVASAYATTIARRSVVEMVVESSWAGAGDLLNRFETFITQVLEGLADGTVMPESKLNSIRNAMLSRFNAPIQTSSSMAGVINGVIKNQDGDWQAEEKEQQILKSMDRETIVRVAQNVLNATKNSRRFAMLYCPINVVSLRDAVPSVYKPFTGQGKMEPKPDYKCSVAGFTPSPTPAPPTQAPTYSSGYGSSFGSGYGSGAFGSGSAYASAGASFASGASTTRSVELAEARGSSHKALKTAKKKPASIADKMRDRAVHETDVRTKAAVGGDQRAAVKKTQAPSRDVAVSPTPGSGEEDLYEGDELRELSW
jgi:secreted Zn-dependent insulinase-like peptidase